MKARILVLMVSTFLLNSIAYAKTVATPYTDRVTQSVGSVGQVTYIPTITWGGDIQTTHANGNSDKTAPGSYFDKAGIKNVTLKRQDVFQKQVEAYLRGDTPYLRGTLDMIVLAGEKLNQDPRTAPIIIYKHSNSRGGDALVVKPEIKNINTLIKGNNGKKYRVGVQLDGPHTYFMAKLIKDVGGKMSDVEVVWYKDLTGTENTPIAAFERGEIDAAFAIIPDALASTGGGTSCNLGECSVKGAFIMLSTKSADKVIMDVYAVRADYFAANKKQVHDFVQALLQSDEHVKDMFAKADSNPTTKKQLTETLKYAAKHLLDSEAAIEDTKGLYADAQHVGYPGQIDFFGGTQSRSFSKVSQEIGQIYVEMGLLDKAPTLAHAQWDYSDLVAGITNTKNVVVPKFDTAKVTQIIQTKASSGALVQDGAMSFPVFFSTGQDTFSAAQYSKDFEKALSWASTYSSAVITIEGHADPTGYLVAKYKHKQSRTATDQMEQAGKNLTLQRANALRTELIKHAKKQGIYIDESQVVVIGHGYSQPINGTYSHTNRCASGFEMGDPCPPQSPDQQSEERRVVFQIVPIEAETEAFTTF